MATCSNTKVPVYWHLWFLNVVHVFDRQRKKMYLPTFAHRENLNAATQSDQHIRYLLEQIVDIWLFWSAYSLSAGTNGRYLAILSSIFAICWNKRPIFGYLKSVSLFFPHLSSIGDSSELSKEDCLSNTDEKIAYGQKMKFFKSKTYFNE